MIPNNGKESVAAGALAADRPPDLIELIEDACTRIYGLAQRTPVANLPHDDRVPASTGAFAKMEQQQVTGSFKLRGATNKILSLAPEVATKGMDT